MQASKKEKMDDHHKQIPLYDPIAFQHAMMKAWQEAQPLLQEFLERSAEEMAQQNFDPMNLREAYVKFAEDYLSDPGKYWELQTKYWEKWMTLWQNSARKFLGEQPVSPEASIEPTKGDRRFKAPEWQESAIFDFIKQSYLLTCQWMEQSVREAQGLTEEQKEKLAFSAKQLADALSPSNFIMTNPEVLKETIESGGKNLVKGFENLIEDLRRGQGELKVSTTDYEAFKLGENIATTKGSVIYQNDLMQLIQYEPATEKVFKRPLLVIPPWINKYYILDLRPDNSFIKWAVEQGHTVFVISWVNPDKKLSQKRFEDYMREGIMDSLTQIEKATGEKDCNAVGYCLGGTLLAIAMAYMQAHGMADKIASATFLTTMLDFKDSGEMKLFMDENQLKLMDKMMQESGVLEAKQLQKTFSLLRANDLIWSFVVNNYLMGREPFPFDLLYWNDDSTNMPAAMHSYYLRKMYHENALVKPGGVIMDDTPIDLSTIKTPIYCLSTREDHIAPWKATYATTQLTGGPVEFTLAASGHIAGVVNAPEKKKYCYWSAPGKTAKGRQPEAPDDWLESAVQHEGSWWPHWQEWTVQYGGEKVPARKPAKGLEPAPGSYVRMKS